LLLQPVKNDAIMHPVLSVTYIRRWEIAVFSIIKPHRLHKVQRCGL